MITTAACAVVFAICCDPASAQRDVLRSGRQKTTPGKKLSLEEYVQAVIEETYRGVAEEVVRETIVQLRLQVLPPLIPSVINRVYAEGAKHPVIRKAFQRAHAQAYQIGVENYREGNDPAAVRDLVVFGVERQILSTRVKRATQQITNEILKRVTGY